MCYVGNISLVFLPFCLLFDKRLFLIPIASGHNGRGHCFLPREKGSSVFRVALPFLAGPRLATGVTHKHWLFTFSNVVSLRSVSKY